MALNIPRQKAYFLRSTSILPQPYTSSDANMLSLGFFIISGLDILGLLGSSDDENTQNKKNDNHTLHDNNKNRNSKGISLAQKQHWIQWIYSFQVRGGTSPAVTGGGARGGFRGTRFWDFDLANRKSEQHENQDYDEYDKPSLANSFMALLMLLMLGDDISRVDKDAMAHWLHRLQSLSERSAFSEEVPGSGSGSGSGHNDPDTDGDMRMCYCAAGIAYILGPEYAWCLDRSRLRAFVVNSQGYEGGVGQSLGLEGHSGLNYCAIATLELLDRLDQLEEKRDRRTQHRRFDAEGFDSLQCIRYMIMRQTSWVVDPEDDPEDDAGTGAGANAGPCEGKDGDNGTTPHEYFGLGTLSNTPFIAGFNGRTNKMADTCYCFWNLSALQILFSSDRPDADPNQGPESLRVVNREAVRHYLLEKTQHPTMGGFGKSPGEYPDLMHSYLGLAALALIGTGPSGQEGKEESGGSGLKDLDPALCVSVGVYENIARLHAAAASTNTSSHTKGGGERSGRD